MAESIAHRGMDPMPEDLIWTWQNRQGLGWVAYGNIRGLEPHELPQPGDRITVQRKDGSRSVHKVSWVCETDGWGNPAFPIAVLA